MLNTCVKYTYIINNNSNDNVDDETDDDDDDGGSSGDIVDVGIRVLVKN